MRWSSSKAGTMCRHIDWSQPKPCRKTIGRPAGEPATRTLFRCRTLTVRWYPRGTGRCTVRRRTPGGVASGRAMTIAEGELQERVAALIDEREHGGRAAQLHAFAEAYLHRHTR